MALAYTLATHISQILMKQDLSFYLSLKWVRYILFPPASVFSIADLKDVLVPTETASSNDAKDGNLERSRQNPFFTSSSEISTDDGEAKFMVLMVSFKSDNVFSCPYTPQT